MAQLDGQDRHTERAVSRLGRGSALGLGLSVAIGKLTVTYLLALAGCGPVQPQGWADVVGGDQAVPGQETS